MIWILLNSWAETDIALIKQSWWCFDKLMYTAEDFILHRAVQRKESVLHPLEIVSFVINQLEAPWIQVNQPSIWQSHLFCMELAFDSHQ